MMATTTSLPPSGLPSSIAARRSTFENQQNAEPPPKPAHARLNSPSSAGPASAALEHTSSKAVKEGLVSQIASRFQRQVEPSSSTTADALRKPDYHHHIPAVSGTPVKKTSLDYSKFRGTEGGAVVVKKTSIESRLRSPEPPKPTTTSSLASVVRTESHQARFNNARALFEKMGGSADDLDSGSSPRPNPPQPPRSASVGRSSLGGGPGSDYSDGGGGCMSGRSRSTSPFAGSRSSSQNSSIHLNGSGLNGNCNGLHSESGLVKNGLESGLVKNLRISFQQRTSEHNNNSMTPPEKPHRPNIKELTNKQRNWFSNFERGKEDVSTPQRRSSVPAAVAENLNATPSGSANLNLPGDRRPLSARSSTSDSIEDYLRNWKKNSGGSSPATTPVKSPTSENNSNNNVMMGGSASPTLAVSPTISTRSSNNEESAKPSKPPLISPKPNPDVVKRFSFNKSRPEVPAHPHQPEAIHQSVLQGVKLQRDSKDESSSVRKFSNEVYGKSLDDLKSDKITETQVETKRKSSEFAQPPTTKKVEPRKTSLQEPKVSTTQDFIRKFSQSDDPVRKSHFDASRHVFENGSPSKASEVTSSKTSEVTSSKTNEVSSSKTSDVSSSKTSVVSSSKTSDVSSSKTSNLSSSKTSDLSIVGKKNTSVVREPLEKSVDLEKKPEKSVIPEEKMPEVSDIKEPTPHDQPKVTCVTEVTHSTEMSPSREEPDEIPSRLNDSDAFNNGSSSITEEDSLISLTDSLKSKLDDSNLFPSLEPTECKKIEEEFEKLTSESQIDFERLLNVAEDGLEPDSLSPERKTSESLSSERKTSSSSDGSNAEVAENFPAKVVDDEIAFIDEDSSQSLAASEPLAPKAIAEAFNSTLKANLDLQLESAFRPEESRDEGDSSSDELHFDPTISSGHVGHNEGGFRNTPITVGDPGRQSASIPDPAVEEMTPTEAEILLSTKLLEKRSSVLSDEQAEEVQLLLTPDKELPPLPTPTVSDAENHRASSDIGSSIRSEDDLDSLPTLETVERPKPLENALDKLDSLVYHSSDPSSSDPSSDYVSDSCPKEHFKVESARETFYDDKNDVHYLSDGHYWFEIPGIDAVDGEVLPEKCYKPPGRLRFSSGPMRQYSTHAIDDYDRRNDEVDPVAASAEYELEKRVEKMDTFPVQLNKGADGLGLSIIGMGVGADTGLEKLGIFIKTITPGGAAARDGRIMVNDQIIEVDGSSLVGVTQAYAASVLRNTSGLVNFVIGRDKDPENSEVAQLIKQSLQADKERADRQRQYLEQLEREQGYYDSSEPTSVTSTAEGEHTLQEEEDDEDGSGMATPEAESAGQSLGPIEEEDLDGYRMLEERKKDEDEIQLLRLKLEEAQCRNMVIEAEMDELKTRLKQTADESQETAKHQLQQEDERQQEQARDSQNSKDQAKQTASDITAEIDALQRKYDHAKRVIQELKKHEQFLAIQLQERDQEYNAHLRLLRDRVIQLEKELATTQKFAGIPVKLPYESSILNSQLSPPELLKNPPILPPIMDSSAAAGDISVNDVIILKEELDSAVPFHQLLDVSAHKSKAELAHKGVLSNRHKPTSDALRAALLRRSVSTLSTSTSTTSFHTTGDSFDLDHESSESKEGTPDSDSGYMASCVTVTTSSRTFPTPPAPASTSEPSGALSTQSPTSSQPSATPPSFLAEMQNVQRRRGIDSSPTEQQDTPTPRPPPKGGVAMFSPPAAGPSGSLADQLKSRLEERRRSREGSGVPESLVADIQQAVRVANDTVRKVTPPELQQQHSSSSVITPPSTNHGGPAHNHHPQPPPYPSTAVGHHLHHSSSAHSGEIPHPQHMHHAHHGVDAPPPHLHPRHPGNSGHVPYSPASSQSPYNHHHSHHQPHQRSVGGPSASSSSGGVVLLSQKPLDPPSYHGSYQPPLNIEPTDAGVIPPEYRTSFHSAIQQSSSPPQDSSPRGQHQQQQQWSANPVEEWAKEQVCQWLLALGMESYITLFMDNTITGKSLLNLDSSGLKDLGIKNKDDREKIKKKIKELKAHNEREKKEMEKEKSKREKLFKKANKKK